MTLGSHQAPIGKSQTHLTPKWITDRLGPFDLDPCACTPPRPWDIATVNYTELDDGLTQPWHGRTFLNPPYDRRGVAAWVKRLADHGTGVALLHARTETDWFAQVWLHADGILFMSERLKFCQPPDGREHPHNSGAPPIIAAFGAYDLARLRESRIPGFLATEWERVR